MLALTVGAVQAHAEPGAPADSSASPSPSSTDSTSPSAPPSASPTTTPFTYVLQLALPTRIVALRKYVLGGTLSPRPVTTTRVDVQTYSKTLKRWVLQRTGKTYAGAVAPSLPWDAGSWTTNAIGVLLWRAIVTIDGKTYVSNSVTTTIIAANDIVVSGALTRADVPYSYRTGCPVGPTSLRKVTFNYWTFTNRVGRGTIVVAHGAVPAVEYVFENALAKRFPIRQAVPADYFYANGRYSPTLSDERAMQEDDTSGFNCRTVTGDPYRISQHSYGNAVDVNTRENPYVTGSHFYPANGRTYLNRKSIRAGMITRSSVIYRAMARYHWLWGGRWAHPDYQHFSSNGG